MTRPVRDSLGEFKAFMEAWDLDDLPDGAWLAHLQEGAQAYINMNPATFRDREVDSHDVMMQYIELCSKETSE